MEKQTTNTVNTQGKERFLLKLWRSELVRYVIIGGLTTVVSMVSFWLFNRLLGLEALDNTSASYMALLGLSNVLSWIIAVTFAYFTNKLFVFQTKGIRGKDLFREIGLFFGARVASLLIEEAGLILLAKLFIALYGNALTGIGGLINTYREMIAKLIMQIVVIVVNYIFSKLVIFKKPRGKNK